MTTEILFWAIRDKTTDHYLPPGKGHNGRGYSYQSTCPPEEVLPRLFNTELEAKRALKCWLRGIYKGDGDWEEGRYWSEIKPQADRIPENMEVVPVTISLNLERPEHGSPQEGKSPTAIRC